MRALGARGRGIALLFLVEAAAIAVLGAGPGLAVGAALSQVIGRVVFGVGISPTPAVVPMTLAAALAVCLVASILPVRRALGIDPAVTLRGE